MCLNPGESQDYSPICGYDVRPEGGSLRHAYNGVSRSPGS